jgi:hypothetical protein
MTIRKIEDFAIFFGSCSVEMYEKSGIEDPDQEADLMHDDAVVEGYLSAISDLERMGV